MQLKKAMCGTKQAARCWWKFFAGNMVEIRFTASKLKPSLYFFKKGFEFVVVWLHVDDRFATGSSTAVLDELHSAILDWMEFKWRTSVERLVSLGISSHGPLIKNQHLLVDQILSDQGSC